MQDVTGFMVGSKSEHGGIIKDGAKMVNAVSNSVVPKFTIIIGNSYGAGNYAMCGKAFDPRLIVAWPSAELAVMGGTQAAKVLAQIEASSLKANGKIVDEAKENELFEKKLLNNTFSENTYLKIDVGLDAIWKRGNARIYWIKRRSFSWKILCRV
jgi:acetyl-CoA carboxylase carboxyltransferase component